MSENRDVTLQLEYPVQLADRTITDVTLRRPTLGDLLTHTITNASDIEGEVRLIAALCNLKIEEMRLMDAKDYFRLQAELLRFRNAAKS